MTSAVMQDNRSFSGGHSSGSKPVQRRLHRLLFSAYPEWVDATVLCQKIWGNTGDKYLSRLRSAVHNYNSLRAYGTASIDSTGRGKAGGPGAYRLVQDGLDSFAPIPEAHERTSDKLLRMLRAKPKLVISTADIARALYGKSTSQTRANLRALIRRLPEQDRAKINVVRLRKWVILGYSWQEEPPEIQEKESATDEQ